MGMVISDRMKSRQPDNRRFFTKTCAAFQGLFSIRFPFIYFYERKWQREHSLLTHLEMLFEVKRMISDDHSACLSINSTVLSSYTSISDIGTFISSWLIYRRFSRICVFLSSVWSSSLLRSTRFRSFSFVDFTIDTTCSPWTSVLPRFLPRSIGFCSIWCTSWTSGERLASWWTTANFLRLFPSCWRCKSPLVSSPRRSIGSVLLSITLIKYSKRNRGSSFLSVFNGLSAVYCRCRCWRTSEW